MGPKALEGITESWNVKDVSDQDEAAVEGDNSCAFAENRSIGIVAHAHLKVMDSCVGNEGRLVRDHVISSACIRYCQMRWIGFTRDGVFSV